MKNLFLLFFSLSLSLMLRAQSSVDIFSDRDNTMYSENPGNSNGAGDFLFSGKTNNGHTRRALIRFDIAASVPAGATITNVTLTLYMSRTQAGPEMLHLHKLTKDWGEAGSNAPGQEGSGTAAMSGDATWNNNFFNTGTWTNPGASGDYVAASSAGTSVAGNGFYTWSSSQLTADVQSMLDNAGSNFGWILIGNENTSQTAKRFNTRENPNSSQRPKLSITYTPAPTPQNLVINEVDYDQPGTDMAEFIELRNNDSLPVDLSNYAVELINGSTGALYKSIALPAVTLDPGEYFVICGNNANTPNCDLQVSPSSNLIQNGAPDAVGLKFNGTTVIDAVSYEGNTVAPYTETSGVGLEDIASNPDMGISRIPDGQDSNVNNTDFIYTCITPGEHNGGPEIEFNLSSGTHGICPGDSILIIASEDNDNPQWFRNGTAIPGATDTFYYATAAGIYNVMADHGSCRDSAASGVEIVLFNQPVVDLGPDTAVCESYLLDAGNAGADYQWNTGDSTRIIQVHSSGSYAVTVTNSNGCTARDTVNLIIGMPFTLSLPAQSSGCDSVLLDPGHIDGASYLWNTGAASPTLTAHSSGKYWVDVEKDGCRESDTSTVTIYTPPLVSLGPDTAICDSLLLTPVVSNATNPSYLWNTGDTSTSITVKGPLSINGMYIVSVSEHGCSASDTIIVTLLPTPSVDLGTDFQACNTATLDAGNSGSSYLWNTGETSRTITVDSSGDYMVEVTNAAGCSASDTVHVTILPSLSVYIGDTVIACDSALLDAGIADAIYLWNTGAQSREISVTRSGYYSVTVTQNGCTGSDSVLVLIQLSPHVDLGPDIIACDSALLDAGAQTGSIHWSTGDRTQSITVMHSGSYSVTVDNNGCTASDTVEVRIYQTPLIDLGPDQSVCDGPLTLSAENPDLSYLWSTGDTGQSIDVHESGIYWVQADNHGCTASDSIKVTLFPSPVFSLGPDISSCDSAALHAPIEGSYEWSTGETTASVTVSSSGYYALTITDHNGCSAADTIHATIFESPHVDLGPDIEACDSAQLSVSNPGSYLWSNGDTTAHITVTHSGIYVVTVTGRNNCSGSDRIEVVIHQSPHLDLGADTTVCEGYTLDAGSFETYLWNTGEHSRQITVDSTGSYAVSVTDSNGCTARDSIKITVMALPQAQFTADTSTCPVIQFTDQSSGPIDTWSWDFGDSTGSTDQHPGHSYAKNGRYTVTLTVSNECGSDSSHMTLRIHCVSSGFENFESYFDFYPNPGKALFIVRSNRAGWTRSKYRILGMDGRVMKQGFLQSSTETLDLGMLYSGTFVLEIMNGDQRFSKIFVITH